MNYFEYLRLFTRLFLLLYGIRIGCAWYRLYRAFVLFTGESEDIYPEDLRRTVASRRNYGAEFSRRTMLQVILAHLCGAQIIEVTATK